MTNSALKLVVGSKNPVKVGAAKSAFATLFPELTLEVTGVSAPSGVADQPMTSDATRLGAINRVHFCKAHHQADFYLAMEGGVDVSEDGPYTFAYVVVADRHNTSVGRSAALPLPEQVYQALLRGEELGHVMDRLFGTVNIKQQGGAIGLLTNGRQSRAGAYGQALQLAMAPFLHPDLYAK